MIVTELVKNRCRLLYNEYGGDWRQPNLPTTPTLGDRFSANYYDLVRYLNLPEVHMSGDKEIQLRARVNQIRSFLGYPELGEFLPEGDIDTLFGGHS